MIRTKQIPGAFARQIMKIRKNSPGTPSPRATGASPPPTLELNPIRSSQSRFVSSPPVPLTNQPAQQPEMLNANPTTVQMNSLHQQIQHSIFFVVPLGSLAYKEISSQKPKFLCNDTFFRKMKSEYYGAKGWLRSWSGFKVFSHCEFCKVSSPDVYLSSYAPRVK